MPFIQKVPSAIDHPDPDSHLYRRLPRAYRAGGGLKYGKGCAVVGGGLHKAPSRAAGTCERLVKTIISIFTRLLHKA